MSVPILPVEAPSLLQSLLTNPQRFDFCQAVRLINQALHQTNSLMQEPTQEKIYFRTTPSLRFPAHQIDQVKLLRLENSAVTSYELQISCLGLFGANGLLPNHYTELLMQRLHAKDSTFRDFIDLFNHRMIMLFYQAWQKNHFYIGYEQAQYKNNVQDKFTHMLSCLVGNGTEKLQHRLLVSDETILFYSSYFANQHRSAWSLKSMLSDCFSIPVEVKPCQNKFVFLSTAQLTRLSSAFNQHNQLGMSTVLGERIWDCQHHFRLSLGPLNYLQFKQFLPEQPKLKALIQLTKRYIGQGITFDICLILKATHVPYCQLSSKNKIALGQNAWLKSRSFTKPAEDTIVSNFL